MLLRKAHVYRLYPTSEQAATLARWVGAVRATFNAALEQRRDFWKPGRTFNFATQCREGTALRAEFGWLRERAGPSAPAGGGGPATRLRDVVGRAQGVEGVAAGRACGDAAPRPTDAPQTRPERLHALPRPGDVRVPAPVAPAGRGEAPEARVGAPALGPRDPGRGDEHHGGAPGRSLDGGGAVRARDVGAGALDAARRRDRPRRGGVRRPLVGRS